MNLVEMYDELVRAHHAKPSVSPSSLLWRDAETRGVQTSSQMPALTTPRRTPKKSGKKK